LSVRRPRRAPDRRSTAPSGCPLNGHLAPVKRGASAASGSLNNDYTDVQIISCGMVLYRKYDTDSNSSTTPPSSQMPRRLQSPGPATNALIQRAGPVAASRPRRSARPSRSPPRGCASGDAAAQEHEATGDALDGPHLLRKRALIESMNDQLKNISQIEHSRHRSVINFFVNLFAGLIAHSLRPKKPSLNLLAATCRSLTSNSR